MRGDKRTGATDVGWTWLGLSSSKVLAFVATVVLSRRLAVGEMAAYIVAVSVAVILTPLADAGFSLLVLRTASRQPDHSALTAVATRQRGPAWALAALCTFGLAVAGRGGRLWLAPLAVLAAIGQAQLDTVTSELQGCGRPRGAAGLRLASGGLALAGSAAVAVWAPSATTGMIAFAAARLIPALTMRPLLVRHHHDMIGWRVAWPLGLLAVITSISVRNDVLLLTLYGMAPERVAVYGIVYQLVVALQIVPVAVALAAFPRMARGDRDVLPRAAGVAFLAVSTVAALVFLDPGRAFSVFGAFYGDHVRESLPLLSAILPMSFSLTAIAALQSEDRERVALRLVATMAVWNVASNAVAIPLFGIRGALFATLSAEVLLCAFTTAAAAGRPMLTVPLSGSPVVLALLQVPPPVVAAGIAVVIAVMVWRDLFAVRTTLGSLGRRARRATGRSTRR